MSSTEPTGVDLGAARAFIAVFRWTHAETVPEAPHEYCLRAWLSPDHQADFDWFVALIAEHGYRGRFWRQEWVYLDVDDRRYSKSRTLDGSGAIINRARLGRARAGAGTTARPGRRPPGCIRLDGIWATSRAATGRELSSRAGCSFCP